MNQYDSSRKRTTASGRSRGRASGQGRTARSAASVRSTGRSNSAHTRSSSYRSGQAPRRNTGRYRRKGPDYRFVAIAGIILIVVITCIAMALKGKSGSVGKEETTAEVVETTEAEMEREVTVDGVSLTGLSKNQAKDALLKAFPWSMTVTYHSEEYPVEDLLAGKIDDLLDEIYEGEPKESYSLDLTGMDEKIAEAASACASKWNKKAKNGSIDSFDAANNKFVFSGEENGLEIDQEKLAADLKAAIKEKRFDAKIEAAANEVAPDISAAAAKEKYKTISSFTTDTTANKNRNTNVRLAAEAINGSVIKPGQEFSFNKTVGQRTEAKGYKGAAAYNNGEVVQEIGGGVCQVSTTLYNAVVRAGLQISYRRSHTFEPSYVTPGMDATVSWDQPDFKFINNSSTAIGIKAHYADQKMTVAIYGIPLLEEGVKWDLSSKKTEDLGVPAPTYEEDQTLQPGEEVVKSKGSSGSRWETYKVVYKDGKEVSRELDHKTTYKGHAPVIRRNTTGVVLNPEETTTSAEIVPSTVDGMPENFVPGQSETVAPIESLPAATTAPAAGPGSSAAPTVESVQPAPVSPTPSATAAAAPSATAAPAPAAPTAAETTSGSSQGPGQNGGMVIPVKPE